MSRSEVQAALGASLEEQFFVVVYHPVTLEQRTEETQMKELIHALDEFKDHQVIFIMPNADPGGRAIAQTIAAYIQGRPKSVSRASLGRPVYLNLLRFAAAIIGNSSSGITEASSFGLPAVNIGDRQSGMPKAANVIDCLPMCDAIVMALQKALDPSFRKQLSATANNPFGDGHANERIIDVLAQAKLGENLLKKTFYDAS